MTFNPKIWFITGISRGLGRELASAALEQGDVVIGTCRSGESDIGAVPDRFQVFALDVTNHRDVVSVVTQAWQIGRRTLVVRDRLLDRMALWPIRSGKSKSQVANPDGILKQPENSVSP